MLTIRRITFRLCKIQIINSLKPATAATVHTFQSKPTLEAGDGSNRSHLFKRSPNHQPFSLPTKKEKKKNQYQI